MGSKRIFYKADEEADFCSFFFKDNEIFNGSCSFEEKKIKNKNAKNLTDISFEKNKKIRERIIMNKKKRNIINIFSQKKKNILFINLRLSSAQYNSINNFI